MRIQSNKLKDIITFTKDELKTIYSPNECRSLALILIEYYAHISVAEALSAPETTINESELLEINFAVKELKNHKPVQYILGQTTFCGITIKVNESVLIPRPETEELVNIIIEENNNFNGKIADLGCGSGCITLALAHFLPNSEVTGFDLSEKALSVAKENSVSLGENNHLRVKFCKKDILTPNFTDETFDIIVSNPPYVREKEKTMMKKNVLCFEPQEALFVPNEDPLKFYRAIAKFAEKNLNSKGKIYLEINENFAKDTLNLFIFSNYKSKIIKDLFAKERFIYLEKLN
ncbi:MAG: peptide chain release factor N(5)-glutamine methyltransferase [Bacteroidales bacterium]|jgi:release factor glutamine methyltransferase|nr:peptide chain release factor N(5)-glutamine methyltransferase [Bacteroidales bacterium]